MQRMGDGDTIGKVDGRVTNPRHVERVHLRSKREHVSDMNETITDPNQ